jgi:hypothetical protein
LFRFACDGLRTPENNCCKHNDLVEELWPFCSLVRNVVAIVRFRSSEVIVYEKAGWTEANDGCFPSLCMGLLETVVTTP